MCVFKIQRRNKLDAKIKLGADQLKKMGLGKMLMNLEVQQYLEPSETWILYSRTNPLQNQSYELSSRMDPQEEALSTT